jgi:hypothetical protein
MAGLRWSLKKLRDHINDIEKSAETVIDINKEVDIEVNREN